MCDIADRSFFLIFIDSQYNAIIDLNQVYLNILPINQGARTKFSVSFFVKKKPLLLTDTFFNPS